MSAITLGGGNSSGTHAAAACFVTMTPNITIAPKHFRSPLPRGAGSARETAPLGSHRRAILICVASLALLGIASSARAQAPAPSESDHKPPAKQNLLVIGASSLMSPVGLHELLGAMLESNQTPMNTEPGAYTAPSLARSWSWRTPWDYVVMDAWQFKRGATNAPEFPDAVTAFVKDARAHSPQCKIILFPWWIPRGPDATNEGVMKVFHHCVEAARPNGISVSTTGPAFMEARFARPDLRITVSEGDAHPGIHGAYLNACSLFAMITGKSPVGLPSTLRLRARKTDFAIAPEDAKYLQELAWKIYQREIEHTNPVK